MIIALSLNVVGNNVDSRYESDDVDNERTLQKFWKRTLLMRRRSFSAIASIVALSRQTV